MILAAYIKLVVYFYNEQFDENKCEIFYIAHLCVRYEIYAHIHFPLI